MSKLKLTRQMKIVMIIIFLLLLSIIFKNFFSSAYFINSTSSPFINGEVGYFYSGNYDFVVTLYVKDSLDLSYREIDDLPNENYSFTSYRCLNNSTLSYDDVSKNINIISTMKDECMVYFDEK